MFYTRVIHYKFVPVIITKNQIMKNRKTIIKKSIVAGLMLTALVGHANDINTNPINNINKTVITLNNVKEGNQLLIKDLNGIVIYKEAIKNTGTYSKGFDLTALPTGDYFFELEKDIEIKSIPFKVEEKKVIINSNETTIYKPYVATKGKSVYVTKLALNKEPLSVKIYSEDGILLHSETINDKKTIEKAYKLALHGDYKMVLSSNGREYSKYISI